MAKLFESITEELQKFIAKQQIFFVGTAPLNANGHVNISPKGLERFRFRFLLNQDKQLYVVSIDGLKTPLSEIN
ncbi:MAG: pyridoxamine 5'-phosphate oxidase family protein [Cyanobacteria bacterium J06629_18]